MTQMRETQAQAQQAHSKLIQMLGMIFAGQEQQRLTNEWVAGSITIISASSGVTIEAVPEPQTAITIPPALVRFSGVAPDPDAMVTETVHVVVATGSPALAASASGGGAAAPPANSTKRNPKARTPASGEAASSTVTSIQIAAGSPPRKKGGLPPNHEAPPPPKEMDELGDDDGDDARRNGMTCRPSRPASVAHVCVLASRENQRSAPMAESNTARCCGSRQGCGDCAGYCALLDTHERRANRGGGEGPKAALARALDAMEKWRLAVRRRGSPHTRRQRFRLGRRRR